MRDFKNSKCGTLLNIFIFSWVLFYLLRGFQTFPLTIKLGTMWSQCKTLRFSANFCYLVSLPKDYRKPIILHISEWTCTLKLLLQENASPLKKLGKYVLSEPHSNKLQWKFKNLGHWPRLWASPRKGKFLEHPFRSSAWNSKKNFPS